MKEDVTSPVLQDALPHVPWMDPRTRRLPGILPLEEEDWLRVDEAFAGQMAVRDRLIASARDRVHALLSEGRAAAEELYAAVLARLRQAPGYQIADDAVTRPDGVRVPLQGDQPLLTLGRLVQEDLCLMQPDGAGEHRLTGAILCFPASWMLAEKIGKPLTGIHVPVPGYEGDLARRVQRLFDAIRPGQGLWRMNALVYDDPTLHQPRREGTSRPRPVEGRYMRCERQCLVRLPVTGAVLFSIHTYVVPVAALDLAAQAGMAEAGLWPITDWH